MKFVEITKTNIVFIKKDIFVESIYHLISWISTTCFRSTVR